MTAKQASDELVERTIAGLHDQVFGVLQRIAPAPRETLDLGAGTGAWAMRLSVAGYRVTAVDIDPKGFAAEGVEFVVADLNQPFGHTFPNRCFQLVTCLEVIEHVENPRNLLRECRRLLQPGGVLVVTTPNIESVAARLRFLATGELRMFGRDPRRNEPTHITPIHTLMFERMLSDTGFGLKIHEFNARTPIGTKPVNRLISGLVGKVVGGVQGGDCHVFVVEPLGE
jgi:2-polyprenyl-3-methyl-5-hydroxy-6-metoxy-1,4-benzoquinol methylase